MSDVLGNYEIGMKQGTRTKFYGHGWNPASLDLPLCPDEVYESSQRHREGFSLERSEFPEAEAVFDQKRFAKLKDILMVGPFYAVKGRLAEILEKFDLGEGGLLPFDFYQSDLVTPVEQKVFLLNFGCRKISFLRDYSGDALKLPFKSIVGNEFWKVNTIKPDAEVTVSKDALSGPDLWFDQAVYNKIFMSDRLAQAIIGIKMGEIFRLKECVVRG